MEVFLLHQRWLICRVSRAVITQTVKRVPLYRGCLGDKRMLEAKVAPIDIQREIAFLAYDDHILLILPRETFAGVYTVKLHIFRSTRKYNGLKIYITALCILPTKLVFCKSREPICYNPICYKKSSYFRISHRVKACYNIIRPYKYIHIHLYTPTQAHAAAMPPLLNMYYRPNF